MRFGDRAQIAANFHAEVTADAASFGFHGLGGADGLTGGSDGIVAFQRHDHDRG